MYCMQAPAYDPTKPTKTSRSCVTKAIPKGGMIQKSVNNTLYNFNDDVFEDTFGINKAVMLFLSVIAMMGKFVLNVKTGNNGRK